MARRTQPPPLPARANAKLWQIKDAITFALSPPPIQGLGTSNGFTFRLQDRGGLGQAALAAAARPADGRGGSKARSSPACASRACPTPPRSISSSTARRPTRSA